MIRPLPAAIEEDPALGRLEVECPDCSGAMCERCLTGGYPLSTFSAGEGWPDIETILTCDDPAEVGEMVKIITWCPVCKTGNNPDVTALRHKDNCWEEAVPVTARLFLWTGRPVEWGFVKQCVHVSPTTKCRKCHGSGWIRDNWGAGPNSPRLTAVVLVGESVADLGLYEVWELEEKRRVDEATRACADAGIPFIIPGDPERRRLTL